MQQHQDVPLRWVESGDGIITLLLDDPAQRVNKLTIAFIEAFADAVGRLERESGRIAGVILQSAKSSFMAGGDLNRLLAVAPEDREAFVADLDRRKALYLRLERFDRPVVAIVNGAALGGGFELTLCCHYRIAVDTPRTVVGLPEVGIGIFPGAGGTVRTVRRLGLACALEEVLLPARQLSATRAAELSLIDAVVEDVAAAEARARALINAASGELPRTPEARPAPVAFDLPPDRADRARRVMAEVAVRSVGLDLEPALALESAALGALVVDPAAKNCIKSHFFGTAALRQGVRPAANGELPRPVLLAENAEATDALEAGGWDAVAELGEVTALTSAGEGEVGACVRVVDPARDGIRLRGWIADNHVGDGQRVLECEVPEDGAMSPVLAALAREGVVVVRLRPGSGSLAACLRVAIDAALADQVRAGRSEAEVAATAAWAGLPGALADHEPGGQRVDIALLGALLDAVAAAVVGPGRELLLDPEDLDAASVRAGGFPGWTGGVLAWMHDGRALLEAIVALRESLDGIDSLLAAGRS